ncbi:MAG: class I SAM-dependent rRNA methyltransferase [Magnetococcales bacterium]|nr:class I SAM-dependent rRNA methyltransferase [Magnetococcales bacterium]
MIIVHLKPGREKSLLRRHPWIFSGAIDRVVGEPASGETVGVRSADGAFLGWGAWSPASQIRLRMWRFGEGEPPGPALFRERIARALALRRALPENLLEPESACRLIHAESDGLPGMIVDRYGPWLVAQFLSAGAEAWREELLAALREALEEIPCQGIYERSGADAREKEGLPPRSGRLWGEEPPELVPFVEGPCRLLADPRLGHKTGFYLDQRLNRAAVARWATGREVLNVFSYTGGFGLRALMAGASRVTQLDSSGPSLALGRQILALNGLPEERVEEIEDNAFERMRRFRDSRRAFDLIILDPPKFAETSAQVEKAARAYKDINLLGCKLLRPGGILATFSCSGGMETPLFRKIVADAALDAGRDAQVVESLGQPGDHPVNLAFPEGEYLKGVICRVG